MFDAFITFKIQTASYDVGKSSGKSGKEKIKCLSGWQVPGRTAWSVEFQV